VTKKEALVIHRSIRNTFWRWRKTFSDKFRYRVNLTGLVFQCNRQSRTSYNSLTKYRFRFYKYKLPVYTREDVYKVFSLESVRMLSDCSRSTWERKRSVTKKYFFPTTKEVLVTNKDVSKTKKDTVTEVWWWRKRHWWRRKILVTKKDAMVTGGLGLRLGSPRLYTSNSVTIKTTRRAYPLVSLSRTCTRAAHLSQKLYYSDEMMTMLSVLMCCCCCYWQWRSPSTKAERWRVEAGTPLREPVFCHPQDTSTHKAGQFCHCLEPNSTTRTPATNTSYEHHQRTAPTDKKIATSQHLDMSRIEMLGSGIAMWQICCRIVVSLCVGGVRGRCPRSGIWLLRRHIMITARQWRSQCETNSVTVLFGVSRGCFAKSGEYVLRRG